MGNIHIVQDSFAEANTLLWTADWRSYQVLEKYKNVYCKGIAVIIMNQGNYRETNQLLKQEILSRELGHPFLTSGYLTAKSKLNLGFKKLNITRLQHQLPWGKPWSSWEGNWVIVLEFTGCSDFIRYNLRLKKISSMKAGQFFQAREA